MVTVFASNEWIQQIGEQLPTCAGVALAFFHIHDLAGASRTRSEPRHIRRSNVIIDKGNQLIRRVGREFGQRQREALAAGIPLTS